jgi:RimJ/RimL family protein N-acetyltransferase
MNDLFTGEWVRLRAPNPETDPQVMQSWHRDSEFFQLAYSRAANVWGARVLKERIERHTSYPEEPVFAIYTLADDQLIGQVGVEVIPPATDGEVWILIGDREYWGKGYGTDAMRLLLRYAFDELGLHRITLKTFSFNLRAIRSYEKVGFRWEGRTRGALNRLGQRWDQVWMGLTRREWELTSATANSAQEQQRATQDWGAES